VDHEIVVESVMSLPVVEVSPCNQTCISQCDKVKEVLDINYYDRCLSDKCKCSFEYIEEVK
jgi:hypothetical protein